MEFTLISRKEAKAKGLTRYYTGKPCKHGHVAERYTSGSGSCVACNRTAGASWKKDNQEKVKAYRVSNRARNTVYQRKYKYGLPQSYLDQMLIKQGKACACCGNSLSFKSVSGHREGVAHVDHCHATGTVRALLCTNCNVAYAHVKEDKDRIRMLLVYAERCEELLPILAEEQRLISSKGFVPHLSLEKDSI